MELISCINSLKHIKKRDIPVMVITDSQYVVKGMNEWLSGWIRRGWINSRGNPVENKGLWMELLNLKNEFKDIEFAYCKGHANTPGNIRADILANMAMDEAQNKVQKAHAMV
jgi:ribonuclease HI